MTAEELLEQENFSYNHFTKLTNTGIEPNKENISKFAEFYLKQKVNSISDDDIQKRFGIKDINDSTLSKSSRWFKQKLLKV